MNIAKENLSQILYIFKVVISILIDKVKITLKMNLTNNDLTSLCSIAIEAARKAGEFIASYSRDELPVEMKNQNCKNKPQGGTSLASQVVTEVDIKSQDIILNKIGSTIEKYDLGLLAEELIDDNSRFKKDYFWCIDPLDGTLPFTQGLEGYSVSIALIAKDGTPVIGVICNPVTQDLYHAIKGKGAYKNGEQWLIRENGSAHEFTFINDRSFCKHKNYKFIITTLNAKTSEIGYSAFKMLKQGGAVMNAIWVLENQPGCYFKLPKRNKGGGNIWDFGATTCIYHELGANASNIYGEKLDLNRATSTFMNHEGVLFSTAKKVDFTNFFQPFLT